MSQFTAIPTTAQPPMGDVCKASKPAGADVVYTFTPQADGMLVASLTPGYGDALVEIRNACADDPTDVLACSAGKMNPGQIIAATQATSGSTYYVVVDDWNGESGGYALDVELQ